jgi:hypothetical protein
MLNTDVGFMEVETRTDLPPQLDVGTLYFLKDKGLIIVNHGDRMVEYGLPPNRLRYMPPHDFGKSVIPSEELSIYVMAYTERSDIGDGTLILNLFDNHAWMYTAARGWQDIGLMISPIAGPESPGVVLSALDASVPGQVSVDNTGLMTVNGFSGIMDRLKAIEDALGITGNISDHTAVTLSALKSFQQVLKVIDPSFDNPETELE